MRESYIMYIIYLSKAAWLWERIKTFIPESWTVSLLTPNLGLPGDSYSVVGLHERLRFLKYTPGRIDYA